MSIYPPLVWSYLSPPELLASTEPGKKSARSIDRDVVLSYAPVDIKIRLDLSISPIDLNEMDLTDISMDENNPMGME